MYHIAVSQRRVAAVVRGRVQGVGYRASCVRRAQELDLLGWVRNCEDGSVALEAQGSAEAIDALLHWCRRGPAAADVRDVTVTDAAIDPNASGRFAVRH